jgi:hypothetical protein
MDESLSSKIRFEKAYHDYLECLKKSPEKNPECIKIIKNYHILLAIHSHDIKSNIVDEPKHH